MRALLDFLQDIQKSLQAHHETDLEEFKNSIPLEQRLLVHTDSKSDIQINEQLIDIQKDLHLCTTILNDIIRNSTPSRALSTDQIELLIEFEREIRYVLAFSNNYAAKTIGYGTFHAPMLRYPLAERVLNEALEFQKTFLEFQAAIHGYSSNPSPSRKK